MAHSVEARVPYCRPTVTEFARSTPAELRMDGSHCNASSGRSAPTGPLAVRAREKLDGAALRNVIGQHASGADNSRLLWGLTVGAVIP